MKRRKECEKKELQKIMMEDIIMVLFNLISLIFLIVLSNRLNKKNAENITVKEIEQLFTVNIILFILLCLAAVFIIQAMPYLYSNILFLLIYAVLTAFEGCMHVKYISKIKKIKEQKLANSVVYCESCGNALPYGTEFCNKCGSAIENKKGE